MRSWPSAAKRLVNRRSLEREYVASCERIITLPPACRK
jgi:hypothetical protein